MEIKTGEMVQLLTASDAVTDLGSVSSIHIRFLITVTLSPGNSTAYFGLCSHAIMYN